jgi:hypothetical protein
MGYVCTLHTPTATAGIHFVPYDLFSVCKQALQLISSIIERLLTLQHRHSRHVKTLLSIRLTTRTTFTKYPNVSCSTRMFAS